MTLNFWTDGDRSVGLDGHQATVTLPDGCEASYYLEARSVLRVAFAALFDDGKVHCATDEELKAGDE